MLKPEKTKVLLSDHPFGVANTTGTPITNPKETKIKENKASCRIDVISFA